MYAERLGPTRKLEALLVAAAPWDSVAVISRKKDILTCFNKWQFLKGMYNSSMHPV